MFLFNLSLAEFMALFSAASAVVFALYLLDRSRRKIVVPALRFWNAADRPVESTRRRRITQWPSLLLQLLSIALLLLAISQLRIGSPDTTSRDHVILLDTSSWMAASVDRVPLMDQAKRQALAYARAVPAGDRVMVAYADALATPATSFETDRRKVEAAIRNARPSTAALDLRQALDFARRAQSRSAKRGGEIVFAGAGRMLQDGGGDLAVPANLRVLGVTGSPENAGIRKIGLRRSAGESDLWHVYVSLRNYGKAVMPVDLALQFGGAPIGSRTLQINPASEQEAQFEFRTRAAGLLEARIRSRRDAFAADDRAVLELPAQPIVPVTVCSDDPASMKPLLDAHPSLQAVYKPVSQCAAAPQEGIGIYDRFVPRQLPARAVLIDPPADRSPIPVKQTATGVSLDQWLEDHPLSAGLRTKDFKLDSARIFTPGPNDIRVAQSSAGPVIVARPGIVVFGFHPMRSSLRYELATPLLFANVLRWLAPESFRRPELIASATGSITVPLEVEGPVEVLSEDGPLPYSISGKNIRFFAGRPGTVRVRSGDREQVFSLTLPDVPEALWEAPAGTRRGIPRTRDLGSSSRDIWYWLALLGGLGLLAEWLLFSPSAVKLPARIASKIGTLAAAALLAVTVLQGQTKAPGNETIVRTELEADLHFLASDSMKGRLTGTPETILSVQWIESRFQRLGLKPVSGGSMQHHYNLTWATLAQGNRMRISWGAASTEPRVLEDFSPLFFTPTASAKGQVTFAGYGIDAPALKWNDLRGSLEGRIALILEGEPRPDDPKSIFDGVVTSVHSDPMRKALNLQAKGAIGVLIVNPGQRRFASEARGYWPEKPPHLKRYAITSWADELRIPVASISPAAAAKILGERKLADLAKASLRDGGAAPVMVESADVEMEVNVEKHVIDDINVVAKIEGTDPVLKDEAVIVSAHYDHNGMEGTQIYNGADDNGSGTVGLLEIAEAYATAARAGQRPKRTVIFAAWGSEERCCGPLLGAWAWIRQPQWPLAKTAAVLNMDMIGRSEEVPDYGGTRFRGLPIQSAASNASAVNIIGTTYSSDMKSAVIEANRVIDMTLRFRYDNNPSNLLRRSDQWPFLQTGVPALWFHTGLHPDYHTVFDRPERIDYTKVERVSRLVHQMSWNLANQEGRPSMIANRTVPPPD